MELVTLKKRSEFLCVKNTGQQIATKFFILQYRSYESETTALRFGFTVSKKVGGAVQRNRIKRRLREIVRLFLKTKISPSKLSFDCVLIARRAALEANFAEMQACFETSMGNFLK